MLDEGEVWEGDIEITTGKTMIEKIWDLLQDGVPRTKYQVGEEVGLSPESAQNYLTRTFMRYNNLHKMKINNCMAYYIKNADLSTDNIPK